ncbi:MAG: phage tail sheath subtilisin-like domain-containing protein [bacterium]|nr:phage tail sheath subtilisin-like domain-containing protein [bacterium]MCM1374323.1 phage tail sheath subtilisin-like domain-containing protein [Muribaculum sp.]
MAEYLSPGVYVEEFDSGIKAMEGVGTSTAGFVGMAQKGPVKGLPVLITSMADYQRRFGGYLSERDYGDKRFLPYAVEQFFNNGGSACYVMRVCRQEGDNLPVAAQGTREFLTLTAANPGAWGNSIRVECKLTVKNRVRVTEPADDDNSYKLEDAVGYQAGDLVCLQQAGRGNPFYFGRVKEAGAESITLDWQGDDVSKLDFTKKEGEKDSGVFLYLAEWGLSIWDDTASEQYESVSFNAGRSNFVDSVLERSQLVCCKTDEDKLAANVMEQLCGASAEPCFAIEFAGGSDGTIPATDIDVGMYRGQDGAPDTRTGLAAFQTISDVSIMAIPGITHEGVQGDLVTHCENMGNRFAILDMPFLAKEVSELQEFRENVDSSYAAMYHPWLQGYDSLSRRNVFLPPSGAIAGIYGRTDNTRGVHKAPANEIVRSCSGLSVNYNEAEQAKLNPRGINLIRALPGQGIRVWGARTCSSDGNWKYVNVRRLFIFIEESIRVNTNWAVFEPNDEMLWSRIEGTIRVFLTSQWRNGALTGTTADEAFFINIGKSTMTEDDILNGRLICVIGVAPVRPAEFVVFRITQKMESNS